MFIRVILFAIVCFALNSKICFSKSIPQLDSHTTNNNHEDLATEETVGWLGGGFPWSGIVSVLIIFNMLNLTINCFRTLGLRTLGTWIIWPWTIRFRTIRIRIIWTLGFAVLLINTYCCKHTLNFYIK